MMKKRAYAAIAAAGLLVVSLGGCGKSGGSSSEGGSDFNPGNRLTMIVPMAPGGGSDLSGRAIASGLEKVIGKSISVENHQGGGGAVGYAGFMGNEGNASYLLATETALVNLPLTEDVPFTWRSFTPIMKVGQDSTIMVVPKAAKYATCADVVSVAKSGAVKVAVSGGVTGNDAIQFGLIEKDQKVQFQRVPYESGGEAIAAALGGHVDVALTNPSEVMGQLQSGDLKPLCVIADKRYDYEELKDIPTTIEQGINVTFAQFRGVIAPGGISDEAKAYWIDAAKKYAESDSFKEYMSSNYMQTDPLFGDDFVKYLEKYEADLKAGLGEAK
ncbi:tripartite tricarboxylate transporter substrate binding protein [Trueperella sp. LYQ143]|uniref:tripartite tricarboxylate transporter substrate binding protein n=1 Tax=Trueperella sp. LYQ143 TaxID=3391059 RepID=UPI003983BADB